MQRGRRSERPTERVEVRGGAVLGVVPDEGMMREIEGDSSEARGTTQRSFRSLRSTQRLSKREHLNSNQPFEPHGR